MRTYSFVYAGSLLLALLLTPLVVRLAYRIGLMDQPGSRKVHTREIPRVGGIAIVLPTLVMTLVVFALSNRVGSAFHLIQGKATALLVAAVFIFLVGLVDDIRGLRARTKFIAQLIAAGAVVAAGIRIGAVQLGPGWTLDFGLFAIPITLLWIIGITNAVNLIDGLDGLAAGIASITCVLVGASAIYNEQPVMAVLMLALLGSLNGFLVFNFNPAKVFMGDCGSLFLGFVLATASVMTPHKAGTLVGLSLPLLALGVPIFDTLFSMLRRLLGRRSMFSADRGHIHHRLVDRGLKQHHAVIVLYGVTLLFAGLGALLMVVKDEQTFILLVLAFVMLLVVFRLAGVVQVRESLASFRRNRAIARQIREEQSRFELARVALSRAPSLEAWWRALTDAADGYGVRKMALTIPGGAGAKRRLEWSREGSAEFGDQSGPMRVTMPVRPEGLSDSLIFEADVDVNGSLESGNRRLAWLGRLMDEHRVPGLIDDSATAAAGAKPNASRRPPKLVSPEAEPSP